MTAGQYRRQQLRRLARPHEQEREDRQHIAQVTAEAGLRAHHGEHDHGRRQDHEIVAPVAKPERKEPPYAQQGRDGEKGQRSNGHFDRHRIQIVVPPPAHLLLTVQIRPFSLLEVVTLQVDAQQVIRRKGHGQLSQPRPPEPISRYVVRVFASQGTADEFEAPQFTE